MARAISQGTMMMGIIAVLFGLAAAYGVRSYFAQEEAPPPAEEPAVPKIRVPVASTDLPADRVVSGSDITMLSLTEEEFKKQFKNYANKPLIKNIPAILNRRLREPMKQFQPFIAKDFYLEGTGPSIAKKLQPGYRAIRVQVPETHQAGVLIGMLVDVLFRANARPAKDGQPAIPERTLNLLRDIEVIDIERPAGTKATTKKKPLLFTLAVPEDKADMFGVIEGRGEVWLVPTPEKDKDKGGINAGPTVPDAETLAELLGIKPPSRPAAPFETAIYRRGNMQVNRFVDGKLLAKHNYDRGARAYEHSMPADSPQAPATRETFDTGEMPATPAMEE